MEQAADWFLRLQSGEIAEDDPGLLAWRAQCPENAEAWLRAQVAWGLLGEHARSPELTRARSDALARVTAAAARRWRAECASPS
jgi:ferric-dicitrate binding protein FerR (iron transport regulator)